MPSKSFSRFSVALAVMLVLSALGMALNSTSQLRIRRVEFDKKSIVSDVTPRLLMYANKQLGPIDDVGVTISPEVGIKTATNGDVLIIEFDRPLAYDTTYSLAITNLKDSDSQSTVNIDRQFRTPPMKLYYLERNHALDNDETKPDDRIVVNTLGSSRLKTWYEATAIDRILRSGNNIAIVTIDYDNTHSMVLKSLRTGSEEVVEMPSKGQLTDLRSNDDGSVIGFSFYDMDQPANDRYPKLYFYDTIAKIFFNVKGLDGEDLQVVDWQFAPDGATIAVVTYAGDTLVIDIGNDDETTLLGQGRNIYGFSGDGSGLYVGEWMGVVRVPFPDGERQSLQTNLSLGGMPQVISAKPFRGMNDWYVTRVSDYSYLSDVFLIEFSLVVDGSEESIIRIDGQTDTILDYYLSQNNQYLFIERSDIQGVLYDNYQLLNRPRNMQTIIVDISSGQEIARINGFLLVDSY